MKMRRSRYLNDFSMWQDNDQYQENFSSLIDLLNTEEEFPVNEDTCQEEIDRECLLSDAMKEARAKTMAMEFRAERRMFC